MAVVKSPERSAAARPAVVAAASHIIGRARLGVAQVRSGGRGSGTGVVWRQGVILTNDHVIAHARGPVQVQLADGRIFETRIGERSPELDLAVLQVDAADLPVVTVGDSRRLRVGEIVFAIGHPWGQPWVVTAGIVSALGEMPVRGGQRSALYIRSDVRLQPGNSGGPLLNARGEVIGINAMVFGGDLSVAIPSHVAVAWAAGPGGRVRLGVGVQQVALPAGQWRGEQAAGLLVVGVEAGEAAQRAGVLVGDVLLAADGVALAHSGALRAALARAGGALRLDVLRAGMVIALNVPLGAS